MHKPVINMQLIIEGCRKGNRNSQRLLFENFAGYGMNICLQYAKHKEEAEEILNNGFLKVFNNIGQYNSEYPFPSWFKKVMINNAIDYYRAHQKQMTFEELEQNMDMEDEARPMPVLSPDEDVLPILQQLSPAYRMVFNLSVMEDYKHEEIADLLGITASASRSNLTRAKEKLRKLVQNNKSYPSTQSTSAR